MVKVDKKRRTEEKAERLEDEKAKRQKRNANRAFL